MKSTAWALLAVMACASAALAEGNCGKLLSYGTLPLVRIDGQATEFVPVEINGVQKLMVLDTGADVTMLTSKAAAEMKLSAVRNPEIRIYDVTGAVSDVFVTTSLKIGSMRGDKINFMVGTPHLDDLGDPRVAGILGADILSKFDISIDYGAHTVALFDQNHCDGQVVYWPERPIAVIPFKLAKGTALQSVRAEYRRPIDEPTPRSRHIGEQVPVGGAHVVFPVVLDGVEILTQLDTGAGATTLEKSKAERTFKLVPGSADTPAAGAPNNAPPSWVHRFKSLSIAGLEVGNPEIRIVPDKVTERVNLWSTGTLLDNTANSAPPTPPMAIGMNVLKHLHVYIAYKEQKLYITPASAPPVSAPAK